MGEWLRRIGYLFTRRRQERELEEEIAFHREMLARDGRARDFGNPLRLREEAREAWGWLWLDRLWQDLAYGARALRRAPAFTLSAVLVLALGTGVNLAAFHVFNVVMFRPLPVRDPDTLARFTRTSPYMSSDTISYPVLEYLAAHNSALAAVMGSKSLSLGFGRDAGEQVRVQLVTPNYFRELGALPAHGRLFDEAVAASDEPMVVLGHGFWQRRLGGDPSYLSGVVHLNRKPATVIGIASADFTGLDPSPVDVWLLAPQLPYFVEGSTMLSDFGEGGTRLFGRLKPGFSPQATEDALLPLLEELRRQYPDHIHEGERLRAHPGAYLVQPDIAGARPEELAVAALVGLLMLLVLGVACANLGSMQLARTLAREREISIRASLGASRWRILHQLVTESFLLAALGTLAGMALSAIGFRILVSQIDAAGFFLFALDYRVFCFAFAIALLATLFFGLPPALQATRVRPSLRRPGRIFVATQIAASCVLLIISGLLTRSVQEALGHKLGFEFERVIAVEPELAAHGYRPAEAIAYWQELRSKVQQMSGVESTALCTTPPFSTNRTVNTDAEGTYTAYVTSAQGDYFSTLAIPLRHGRRFAPGDQNAVIVGEKLARQFWPDQNPIGQTWGKDQVVIGVAAPARTQGLRDAESTELYLPLQAADHANSVLLVKTRVPPENLLQDIRFMAEAQDRRLLPAVTLLKDTFYLRLEDSRRAAQIASGLSLLAAMLAAVGVYGQISYSVARRQKEIGVRLALGALRFSILALVLRQLSGPALSGVVVGGAIASAMSSLLRRELYGLSYLDPISYAGAVALLLLIALLAALVPARRALRVDIVAMLRQD